MKQLLDKIKNLDPKYVPAIVGGIVAIVLVLDFFVLLKPQMGWFGKISQEAGELQTNINTLKINKQRIAQFQAQLRQARADLTLFDDMVYTKGKVPAVLRQISSFAKEYGIKIEEMIPQPMPDEPVVKNDDGQYFGQDIFIRGFAGFHEFATFLNRLERENMFWVVEYFSMEEGEESIYRHLFKIKVKLLVLEKAS